MPKASHPAECCDKHPYAGKPGPLGCLLCRGEALAEADRRAGRRDRGPTLDDIEMEYHKPPEPEPDEPEIAAGSDGRRLTDYEERENIPGSWD